MREWVRFVNPSHHFQASPKSDTQRNRPNGRDQRPSRPTGASASASASTSTSGQKNKSHLTISRHVRESHKETANTLKAKHQDTRNNSLILQSSLVPKYCKKKCATAIKLRVEMCAATNEARSLAVR